MGDDHHNHLERRRCRALADVVPSATTASLQPTSTHGYLVDEAEVLYRGLCPACQQPPT